MRNYSASISFVLVFFLSLSIFAQDDVARKLPFDAKVITGKLDNGLTYYIRENKKPEKKVELRLVIKVGSIMEDDDQQGLAHMAEHMAFNGTKNFKKNDIVSYLQSIGVEFGNDLNAYTSFDETVYILPIPTDQPSNLEKGFQILEDWAHQVTYLDEDINSERAIILEESRMGKSGEERMFKKIYPELFKGSKYAQRLPIGVDSIIKTFNPNAIRRFYPSRNIFHPFALLQTENVILRAFLLTQKTRPWLLQTKKPLAIHLPSTIRPCLLKILRRLVSTEKSC